MLDHFLRGAASVSGVEIHKVHLTDIPIDHYSYENKTGPLPHETEFQKLCERIQHKTDGLVIATPTYNFSVPAQLKNFIDRMRFFGLDFSKRNKLAQPVGKLHYLKTYFLVSGGTPNWAQKILFFTYPPFWLRGVFLYHGAQVMGSYYSGDTKTYQNDAILRHCYNKGKRYALWLTRGKKQGILENIFWRPPQSDEAGNSKPK